MTGSVSNPSEIEDVLSSIRRLVAEDGTPRKDLPLPARPPAAKAKTNAQAAEQVEQVEDPSAFVLTTDQRVEADVTELHAAAAEAKPDATAPQTTGADSEETKAVWTAEDFLNAKLKADAEVGDIGIGEGEDPVEDLVEPEAVSEAEPDPEVEAEDVDPAEPDATPEPEAAMPPLKAVEDSAEPEEVAVDDTTEHAQIDDAKEDDPDERGPIELDYKAPAFEHVDIDALEPSEFEEELDRSLEADVVPPIAMADPLAQLDEEMLKEIVADLVRKELQGAMGEKITRNVRKLVRREIQRALASQDLN